MSAATLPKFSLVIGTLGRTEELRRLLKTIESQTFRRFELIVVDQNPDDRVEKLLAEYANRHPIIHLRATPGLSRARNLGLKSCSGDIVAFPDDDCWYPPDLLEQVAAALSDPEWDGLAGQCLDERGKDAGPRVGNRSGPIDRYNVWWRVVSTSMFLKRHIVDRVGQFDETLGLGAGTLFGSGEETDYLIRVLQHGFRIQYSPTLFVGHPKMEGNITSASLSRAYFYGAGMGRVLTKHRYPIWFKMRSLIRPLVGAIVALARFDGKRARIHWNRCLGRGRGLLSVQ